MNETKDLIRMELLEEWMKLFAEEKDYYIYGAANTAKQILAFAKSTGVADKVKGFVVTNGEENPGVVEELPVMDIHLLQDTQAVILVPHAGLFKEEINSLLEELGFVNIQLINRFCYFAAKQGPQRVADSYMEKAKEMTKKYDSGKSNEEKERDALLRERILQIREEGQPDFGQVQFYQSFEKIGVTGTRPSLYRVMKYGLENFLTKEQDILDIGCNTGFLDMTISPLVHSITGVEYDRSLVAIANCVKEHLKADNCMFVNSDFCDWYKANDRKYDVILSFAIHHWLNLSPEEYTRNINTLLEKSGYLCFESHDLSVPDKEFDACLKLLLDMNYVIKNRGSIMDDGITKRDFVILWKPE